MDVLLKMSILFFIGAINGYIIELFYRRFFSLKKWINPGLLKGPYLPLYGFGIIGLYLLSNIDLPIDNKYLKMLILLLMMGILMTIIEYITGLIFIKIFHIKLWDYSNQLFNIQSIICPVFSFFWIVIACIYYFLVNPYIIIILNFIQNSLFLLMFIMMLYILLIIDLSICLYNKLIML